MHISRRRYDVLSVVVLGLIVLGLFGPVLINGADEVISSKDGDLSYQLYYWRAFAFREMSNGNFPLWNPYIFSGTPFHSGFQAGLLYPPHWLHLILPTPLAINILVAFHTFLLGVSMYGWARSHRLSPMPSFYSAVAAMLGGTYILHVYPGHLPNLATMSWTPALLLAVDRLIQGGSLKWLIFGGLVACMQVFAGHPQYVFYCWVALSVYVFWRVIFLGKGHIWKEMPRAAGLLFTVGALGALLSAAQWLPGIEASRWGVRKQVSDYAFASMFSFPPENLLTFLNPFFMGDGIRFPYWGRYYLWEMCLFMGTVTFSLSIVALALSRNEDKRGVLALAFSAVICLLLAMGSYMPFHEMLYKVFYPFRLLRGSSKFAFFASMMIALMAGVGLQRLLEIRSGNKGGKGRRWCIILVGILALLSMILALSSRWGVVEALLSVVKNSGKSFLPQVYYDPHSGLLPNALSVFQWSWAVACVLLTIEALLIHVSKRHPKWVYLLACIGIAELFAFSSLTISSFSVQRINEQVAAVRQLSKEGDGYRVLLAGIPSDLGMSAHLHNIHGFDADVYAPYARFLWESQDQRKGVNVLFIEIRKVSPLFRLLGLRYIVGKRGSFNASLPATPLGDDMIALELPGALPKGYLVDRWRLDVQPAEALKELKGGIYDPYFEARISSPSLSFPSMLKQVISIEDIRRPPMWSSHLGAVWYVEEDTDTVHFIVKAERDAVLVTTEIYHPGWKAWMDGLEVPVLRVNYIQRGIAVPKGLHLITMRYAPGSWLWGKALSLAGLSFVCVLLFWTVLRGHVLGKRGLC